MLYLLIMYKIFSDFEMQTPIMAITAEHQSTAELRHSAAKTDGDLLSVALQINRVQRSPGERKYVTSLIVLVT